jgi:hypothetical protein
MKAESPPEVPQTKERFSKLSPFPVALIPILKIMVMVALSEFIIRKLVF